MRDLASIFDDFINEPQLDIHPAMPAQELPVLVDYIQAETFLENSDFFTPSSKRIRGIYSKKKTIKPFMIDTKPERELIVEISANHDLGLPTTSDLDYYRALQKILDEQIDTRGRIQQPVSVPIKKAHTIRRERLQQTGTPSRR